MAKVVFSKFIKLLIFFVFIFLGIFIFYKNFNVVPKRDYIKIVIKDNNYPFSFKNDEKEPDGFEVEILKQVFDSLKIKYEIKLLNEDEVIPSIKLGLYDIGMGQVVCRKGKWKETIFCSHPYITSKNVLYKKDEGDLLFKKIAKEKNTNFSFKKLKKKFPSSYILEYEDLENLFLNYDKNNVDAVLLDKLLLENAIKEHKVGDGYIVSLECKNNKKICKEKKYVMIFSKDFLMKDKIDKEFERFLRSNDYKKIYNKWF